MVVDVEMARTDPDFLYGILEATGRGVLVIAPGGRVVYANGLADAWLKVPAGKNLAEVQPVLWQHVRPVLDEETGGAETPLQTGGREYLAAVNPLYRNQKLAAAVCILVEAGQLENMVGLLPSLETLARELDAIIDSSSDGLFVCDGEANVLRVNPASEKIHRLAAEKIVGRNMRELIEQGFIDRSAALETSLSQEPVTLLQSKDGRKLMSSARPVFDDQGRLARIVVSERDISELDRLQRQLEEQQAVKNRLRDQVLELQGLRHQQDRVIARSPNMLRALQQAIKVSQAESTVLILGESGVGKGLIAELIHQHSTRCEAPLVKINCGAIPESLIEAELFGYEKGAFTGAQTKGKLGYLELADGGILFLDEIAELPLASQVKLLRFLEDGLVTRLGATAGRRVDVRILAATHQDLAAMVEEGRFRQDLYYRLNVIPILVPAVRERAECLVPLLRHYLDHFAARNRVTKRLTARALDVLTAYDYPGNVRELMNICERLVVMTETETIDEADLPGQLREQAAVGQAFTPAWREGITLQEALDRVERSLLEQARQRCGSQTEMAEALGVNQSTIARKLKRHGLI